MFIVILFVIVVLLFSCLCLVINLTQHLLSQQWEHFLDCTHCVQFKIIHIGFNFKFMLFLNL